MNHIVEKECVIKLLSYSRSIRTKGVNTTNRDQGWVFGKRESNGTEQIFNTQCVIKSLYINLE